MGVSAVVLTYNNRKTIARCLESLTWVNELIIVDSFSDDGTRDIIERKADKIIQKPRAGPGEPYDHYRRDGFEVASNNWIVTIDADEWIPDELANLLQKIANDNQAEVVLSPKMNLVKGRWINAGYWWPDYSVVMVHRGYASISPRIHDFFTFDDDARHLKLPLDERFAVRHRLFESYIDAFQSNHRYAKIRSRQESFNIKKLAAFPGTFWKIYIKEKSYRAGVPGLVLSFSHALYRTEVVLRILYQELVGRIR